MAVAAKAAPTGRECKLIPNRLTNFPHFHHLPTNHPTEIAGLAACAATTAANSPITLPPNALWVLSRSAVIAAVEKTISMPTARTRMW